MLSAASWYGSRSGAAESVRRDYRRTRFFRLFSESSSATAALADGRGAGPLSKVRFFAVRE